MSSPLGRRRDWVIMIFGEMFGLDFHFSRHFPTRLGWYYDLLQCFRHIFGLITGLSMRFRADYGVIDAGSVGLWCYRCAFGLITVFFDTFLV